MNRQVKEVESEISVRTEEANTVSGTMGRVLAEWDSYKHCLHSLQVYLGQSQAGHKVLNKPVRTLCDSDANCILKVNTDTKLNLI